MGATVGAQEDHGVWLLGVDRKPRLYAFVRYGMSEPFSIVIPSRDIDNLRECIAAIRRSGCRERMIVVDDGIDPCPQWSHESEWWGPRYGEIAFIPGIKPFNFSRNCNIAIREAGDNDVVLCNDDATLQTPNGFTALAECARQHPECGIISPVTDLTGNFNQFQGQGIKGVDFRYESRRLCFFCVYIPRETFKRVAQFDKFGEGGLLDSRFPSFAGDDDFSLRCVHAGLKLGITETCYVKHSELHSTFRGDPRNPSDYQGSQDVFQQKWGFRAV